MKSTIIGVLFSWILCKPCIGLNPYNNLDIYIHIIVVSTREHPVDTMDLTSLRLRRRRSV